MTQKLRTESSTATISANDINVRLGNTGTTAIDFNNTDVSNLGFESNTLHEKTFRQYHNKWKMVTGDYGNTTGYIESFLGGSLGSMTVTVMSSLNDGGWYLGSSIVEGRIAELSANTTSGASTIMNFKIINNTTDADITSSVQGWVRLTIRTQNLGGDVFRNKSTYASFNSVSNMWQWAAAADDADVLGTSHGSTRYIQLD